MNGGKPRRFLPDERPAAPGFTSSPSAESQASPGTPSIDVDLRPHRHILVVDDEESLRYTFRRFLSEAGFDVATAGNFAEAVEKISGTRFSLVFADIILGAETGIDLLREIRSRDASCPVIMITGYPNLETATDAVRFGAFDYLSKPVTQERLLNAARLALNHRDVIEEKERYRSNLETIFLSVKDGIITVDEELTVIEMNQAVQDICGMTRSASLGKSFRDLTGGCHGKCREVLEETIRTGLPRECIRTECRSSEGRRNVVTLSANPLAPGSSSVGAVMVIRDETRLSDLEHSLEERRSFSNIVGSSPPMQQVYSLIENLADIDTTVLITGESGTGKELVAEALHYRGNRGDRPLVKVNCSALSENLLESELFGHVKGAYTGAVSAKIGRFERADGGTIFLDEIGDLSAKIQLQLLRILQEKEFERVGDSQPLQVDVRVIAATNRDLRELVSTGKFREDLFYRLKVVDIALPPLRDRRGDIPLLTEHFVGVFNRKFGKEIRGVSEEVAEMMLRHAWPGNVRELMHVLEHGAIMCRDKVVTAVNLPRDFLAAAQGRHARSAPSGSGLEKDAIVDTLRKTDGNKAKAARILGMSRQTLYRRIQELGVEGSPKD